MDESAAQCVDGDGHVFSLAREPQCSAALGARYASWSLMMPECKHMGPSTPLALALAGAEGTSCRIIFNPDKTRIKVQEKE